MTQQPQSQPKSDGRLTWPDGVPRTGEVIGAKYVVEGLLGAGGMGVVLAARHSQLGQQVAIKVLLPESLRDPVANERFLREARAAIAIRSEHVARVMDFGTLESGSPYLVMEHLEGNDLKEQLLRRSPLPISTVIDYVIQACEALCEAHKRGIVHRDLKPANLFLSARMDGSPHVRVLDFGISKTVSLAAAATGSGDGITRTDAVFGTPAYMSPEQLRSSKLVDHRTDLWSLGVVLYELLTGKLPFGSTSDGIVAMCAHILEDPPPPMRAMRPDVPPALEAAVIRCLAKQPAERFQSISELTDAISAFGSSGSAEIAARIARMSDDNLAYNATVKSDSGPLSAKSGPNTSSAWGKTGSPTRRRSVARIGTVAAVMLTIGFAIGGAWILGSRSASRTSSSTSTSVEIARSSNPAASDSSLPSVSTSVAAAAPTAPSAAVIASAAPAVPPAPVASASPAAPKVPVATPTAKPEPAKSAAPEVPKCEAGKAMSNGHCCRVGFEWKGGECVPGTAKVLP
ncbi:MAG: serine/threonine protein kinase [Deltaproteobacteria bacterium]|nr:serine/threonine protein kinase [Deltaproteobacteria bacterium]